MEASTRTIVHERHWMHIWKVGYSPCVTCRNDSRVVVTVVDENDETVSVTLYCADHVPSADPAVEDVPGRIDLMTRLRFGLGFSVPLGADDD